MLGIFDSGFGGLTVLRAIREILPDLSITYLGDSARAPYGNRSRETVTAYTKECWEFLFSRGCTLIILACNTASAETLRELQQNWLPLERSAVSPSTSLRTGSQRSAPMNILGVIRPLAEEAAALTKKNRIAVVGTRSTVESGAYIEELKKLKPEVTVIQQACPLLVPLVEEGYERKPETRKILRTYLAPVKSANPDVLILGCTHYETLHPLFQQNMGKRCTVLHSPSIVALKLREYLSRHPEYASTLAKTAEIRFMTTGDPIRFRELGERFYGGKMGEVEKVNV